MKLLIVMPVCANDGPLAERALEFIYRLNSKKQTGHLLLVANADLHAEMRKKIKVTAEMAFESVTETVAPALPKELANHKIKQMNNLFRHAAQTAQNSFRWPWLWLEPDCTPLKSDWIAQLASAYDTQPRKYMGMVSKNANDKLIMARCGVYYPGASYELDKLCQGESPFATACAEKIVESASNSPLVDYLPLEWEDDIAKISPKAVICHGDKQGIFAENWRSIKPIKMDAGYFEEAAIKAPFESLAANPSGTINPQSVPIKTGTIPESPGLTRRQKRELEQAAVQKEISDQIDKHTLESYSKLSLEEMAHIKMPIHLAPEMRAIEVEKLAEGMPSLSRRQKRELVNNGTKV